VDGVKKKNKKLKLYGELWWSPRLELSYSTNKLQDWKHFGVSKGVLYTTSQAIWYPRSLLQHVPKSLLQQCDKRHDKQTRHGRIRKVSFAYAKA
jgi:hypothetical protein